MGRCFRVILLLLLLAGCGSRQRQMKVATTTTQGVVLEHRDLSTNTVLERRANVWIYTPIDPAEPMTLPDGSTSKNVRIEKRAETETQTQISTDQTQTKTQTKAQNRVKEVDTQSKRGDFWRTFALPVGIGLAVALVLVAYFRLRRSS